MRSAIALIMILSLGLVAHAIHIRHPPIYDLTMGKGIPASSSFTLTQKIIGNMTPLESESATSNGSYIFILGGLLANGVFNHNVYVYHNGSFTTLAPIPLGVVSPSVFWFNHTLWYIGGTAYGGMYGTPFPYVMKYEHGKWVNVSRVPISTSYAYYFVYNNSMWIVGGYNESYNPLAIPNPYGYTNLIQVYDGHTWKILHAPVDMGNGAFEFVNNTLYIVGGMEYLASPTNMVWKYFPHNNTWVELPSLPYPSFGGSLLVINSTFMVYVGGWTLINGNYVVGLIMVLDNNTWYVFNQNEIIPTLNSAYVQIGNTVLIFGGFTAYNQVSGYIVNITVSWS